MALAATGLPGLSSAPMVTSSAIARLESGDAHVVVMGAGYVGLPLAVELARGGLRVTALDADAARIGDELLAARVGGPTRGLIDDPPVVEGRLPVGSEHRVCFDGTASRPRVVGTGRRATGAVARHADAPVMESAAFVSDGGGRRRSTRAPMRRR